MAKEREELADAAELGVTCSALQGIAAPVERSGHMAVEMREVSKLGKIEDLWRSSRLVIESHYDRIHVWIGARDQLRYRVALPARAHWSV